MRNAILCFALLLSYLSGAAELPPKILAFAERDSALYKAGEKIRFKVWMFQPESKDFRDPQPDKMRIITGEKIHWEIIGDGKLQKKGTLTTTTEPVVIETSLDRPGFVMLKLVWDKKVKNRPLVRWAGAGVEPEKIVSGTGMPADFEVYWQKRISEMRSRKAQITVREAPEMLAEQEKKLAKAYDVRIEDGVINATGVLTVPLYPGRRQMPVIISFGGASWIGARTRVSEAVARNAMIFHMNIHDTKNRVTRKEIGEFRRTPEISAYALKDLQEMDKYRPGKVFLRIVRCLDYLKTRPEWDRKNLIATGPSFGGCQSIVAAALDKDVTLCFPGGPAMCDHLGYKNRQASGWPQLLNWRTYRDKNIRAQAEKNSAYFDAANMARLIKCPTVFAVGFIDTTCHPTSVYAAYNNVPHKNKSIINATRAAHGGSYKRGEPGAFSATNNPLYLEACNGREMLKNGSFRYITGKNNAPYFWDSRQKSKLTVKGDPEKDSTYLEIPANGCAMQSIRNIRKMTGRAVLTGRIRGTGKVTFRLSGNRNGITVDINSGKWQEFKQTIDLSSGEMQTFEITSNRKVDVTKLSLQY